jgi:hypothetical protein
MYLLTDVWNHKHPNSPGYTYDSEVNTLINYTSINQARFDRFMFHSIDWDVDNVEIIANQGIELETKEIIFPSDHFGLRTLLVWKDPTLKFDFQRVQKEIVFHFSRVELCLYKSD